MAEIYEKGQVVIPKYIRDMFGFTPGTKVRFRVQQQMVVLEKDDFAESLDAFLKKYAKRTFKETEKIIKEAREERYRKWMDVPGL